MLGFRHLISLISSDIHGNQDNQVNQVPEKSMQKAIIIGASEGIGRELARVLAGEGIVLGLAARRLELLTALQNELPAKSHVKRIDVSRTEEARKLLDELVREMGGVDLIIISAGVIFQDPGWDEERATIGVNVTGFTAMFNYAFNYFCKKGTGHIVGISSVAAVRGGHCSSVYNASKAFVSSLMHGFRIRARRMGANIQITDVMPGHVSTGMMVGQRGAFWVIPTERAARQIAAAIKKKRKHAYITPRWRIVAGMMRILPDGVYARFES
jgi:short-subunit dehydrogenase